MSLMDRIFARISPRRARQTLIGIELGAASVRMVVLTQHRGRFHVKVCEACAFEERGAEAALSDLLSKHGIRHGVVAVVSSAPVMTRSITLPSGLSDDEIDIHIRLEAHKYIPHALDEVSFDFVVQADDGEQMQVLLVMMRTDSVDECVSALASCGLDVNVVDVPEFALSYALSPLLDELVGRVLVVYKDDVKTHIYAASIERAGVFAGFDHRQEYLGVRASHFSSADEVEQASVSMDDDKKMDNALTANLDRLDADLTKDLLGELTNVAPNSNNQADNHERSGGAVGMGFDEFLAMYQQPAEQSLAQNLQTDLNQTNESFKTDQEQTLTAEDRADTALNEAVKHIQANVAPPQAENAEYVICFDDFDDFDELGGSSQENDERLDTHDDYDKHDYDKHDYDKHGVLDGMDKASKQAADQTNVVSDIQKMLAAYEYDTKSSVDVVVLAGLVDETVVDMLAEATAKKVLLADPFANMVGEVDLCQSMPLVVACGAAMRADMKGVL